MNELVSILIPVYNREEIIGETISSALAQSYDNIEVIIVDNASTDRTWSIVQRFAKNNRKVRCFRNSSNIGPVRNWKKCIEEAKGLYGKILWSDDLIDPDFVEKTVPFLGDNRVGFVYSGAEIFGSENYVHTISYNLGSSGIHESDQFIKGALFGGNYPVSPGCALFRLLDLKENLVVDVPNNINSDFSSHGIGSDLLLFLLTASKYEKFAFVSGTLSHFRAHSNSISIQSRFGRLQMLYCLAKAYFVESVCSSYAERMNGEIWLTIMKHFAVAKELGLDRICKFYTRNRCYKIEWEFVVTKVVMAIARRIAGVVIVKGKMER